MYLTDTRTSDGDPKEDGIRDSVASRGLGDVYKRQVYGNTGRISADLSSRALFFETHTHKVTKRALTCPLDYRICLKVLCQDFVALSWV